MKKFLSMVLALVMVMSLVTVSAGAKDFTDDEAITYEEAVAVVSEIGVVDGYTDGTFKPANTLTRQAAAKIICNLILGPTTAAELHADTAPYKDVPANGELAGYIAFCAKKGIISGYKDGTFRPGGTLTGYAFMKMLLGALGYDATLEQYTGPNWSINVAKQAIGIGLDDGIELKDDAVFNGLKAVTREEACLYAFNTLQADLVEYGQRLTTNINGTEVTLSAGGAKSREWNSQQSRYDHIRPDNLIQFAEEYFNKLEKKADTDDFERPAHTWLYDKVKIGTYVDWEKMMERYTSGVSGRDLYELLTSTTIRDNDLEYYVNGLVPGIANPTAGEKKNIAKTQLVRSNQDDVGITDDGVLTEVFLDKDKELITIVSVNTWLAQAAGDYSESKEYAPMTVYYDRSGTTVTKQTWNVDVEDVASVVDVKEDDFRLVKITWKNNTRGDVVVMVEPDVMEQSTVTKFSQSSASSGDGYVKKLTTGGTEYKRAQKAFYDEEVLDNYNNSLLTDKTYNIYMDEYGYFIGVDLYEGTKNYVFITGFDRPTSNLSISTARANGIFLDGTMELMTVNVTDTDKNIETARNRKVDADNAGDYFVKWREMPASQGNLGIDGSYRYNRWFTYTKNEAGVYTLTPATRMNIQDYAAPAAGQPAHVIKTDNVYITDNVLVDNNWPYTGATNTYGFAAKYQYDRPNTVGTNPAYVARSYGNDDSVFITVSLDDVDTSSGAKAITSVEEVYTGVDNAEIEIDTSTAAQEAEVYTVFNRNGYIIGAVVIGEGKGSNASIGYIMSDVKSEEKKDDTYYWEFDVIHEGEIKTLTAKSKYSMFPNTIAVENADHGSRNGPTSKYDTDSDGLVELRFDADGYVVNIKEVQETKIYSQYGSRTPVVPGANSLNQTLKMEDARAYRMNVLQAPHGASILADSIPNKLELAGRTLYVNGDRQDEGLVIATGAKAVVVQDENGKSEVKSEFASVDAALAHLADADTTVDGLQYNGEIVAAIDSRGAATWVLFWNYTELVAGNQNTGRFDLTDFEVRLNTLNNSLTVHKDGGFPTVDEAMKAVSQWLTDNKGTVVDVKWVAGSPAGHYEFTVEYTVANLTYKTIYTMGTVQSTDLFQGQSVNVDGKPVIVDNGITNGTTTPTALATAAGLSAPAANTQALITTNKGRSFYCPIGSAITLATGEEVLGVSFGYVKVSITGTTGVFDNTNDATGFYEDGNADSTSVKNFADYYVKAKSDVAVNVTMGQRDSATENTLPANGYDVIVTYGEGSTSNKTASAVVAKTVRPGSAVKVVLKEVKADVEVKGVNLKDKT